MQYTSDMTRFKLLQKSAQLLHGLVKYDPILPLIRNILLTDGKYAIEQYPPIFIIGAPRTGSTYLFQVLASYFQFAYLTNFSSIFFKTPSLAIYINKLLGIHNCVKKTSEYGFTPGVFSPSEGGPVFNYWFGPVNQSGNFKNRAKIAQTEVHAISSIMEAPFLAKNLNNSMRLPLIIRTFPNACFIQIKRNPLYVAQSLILARRRLFGDQSKWFGPAPPEIKDLERMPPFEQVVMQIKLIEEHIDTDIAQLNIKRVIELDYEDLCGSKEKLMRKIAKDFSDFGVALQSNTNNKLDTTTKSERKLLDDADFEHLQSLLRKHWPAGIYK
jgi:hypothetical protein